MFNKENLKKLADSLKFEQVAPDWSQVPEGLLPQTQILSEHELINSGIGYVIHKMILKNVSYQEKMGRPIDTVTLSRAKYDKYEKWLRKMGFQTEENCMIPLTCNGHEILRATDSRMEDITINYRGVVAGGKNLEFLDKNIENLKIENTSGLNDVLKQFKNKGK